MTTGAMLGFGAHIVELPKESFMAVRGAVILLMPAEAAQSLPALRPRDEEK